MSQTMANLLRPDNNPNPPLQRSHVPFREHAFRIALQVSILIALAFLASLLIYVTAKGWGRLDSRLWEAFPSIRRPETSGARSAIFGTIWVVVLTAIYALPTGVLAAIYLEEYANPNRWYNRMIEINIQNLAAVPSIVYGILGLGIISRGLGFGQTVMTAALTLSLLVLPIVVIATREAIRAVPRSIREGGYALGSTQWQVVRTLVLPQAIPGIATGSILALSRAIGEAAPLLLLGGLTFITFNPTGVMSPFTVLPIQIFNWTSQSRDEFEVLASAACVILLIILVVMNSLAIWIRNRSQRHQ